HKLEQAAGNLGGVAHRLGKLSHRHASCLQTLRHGGHLVGIKVHAAYREPLHQITHGPRDRGLEVQWIFRARLKDAMADKDDALRLAVERDDSDGGAIVLHRRVDTDPHGRSAIFFITAYANSSGKSSSLAIASDAVDQHDAPPQNL